MLQDVLAEPAWSAMLTPVDRRALTSSRTVADHVNPFAGPRSLRAVKSLLSRSSSARIVGGEALVAQLRTAGS